VRLTSSEMDAGHSRGLEAHLASCRCAVSHFHTLLESPSSSKSCRKTEESERATGMTALPL
jgi:hypothetical protein